MSDQEERVLAPVVASAADNGKLETVSLPSTVVKLRQSFSQLAAIYSRKRTPITSSKSYSVKSDRRERGVYVKFNLTMRSALQLSFSIYVSVCYNKRQLQQTTEPLFYAVSF